MDPVAGNLHRFSVTVEGVLAAGGPGGSREAKRCAVLEWEDSDGLRQLPCFTSRGTKPRKVCFFMCVRVHDGLVSSPRPDPRCAEGHPHCQPLAQEDGGGKPTWLAQEDLLGA